jgi:3-oxoacyl-[acyl-carrier protein] reductase
MRLSDKVAVVTGAARGLGKAIARRFLQEGATVVLIDVNQEGLDNAVAELQPLGRAEGVELDITQFQTVQDKFREIIEHFGKIDILVNNAGITADAQLSKMTEEQFDSVIRVNLKGTFCCARAVAGHMIGRGYGKIINIASVCAHNGNFGQTNYTASKAGVIAMTQTWAKELGKKGINVNAVAPGYTLTEMVQKVPPEILGGIVDKTPLRRLGQPEEIAGACAYLASDEAAFVQGAVFRIDGGLVL